MNENNNAVKFNAALFIENRNKVAPEVWFKHAGRYVAWNLEGTLIVASGADEDELYTNLRAAGIEMSRMVQSYVDPPDVTGVFPTLLDANCPPQPEDESSPESS
jgi:hypothetical protein